MPSRLPQHQHRGVILPMLSSTIKSADLNDVCTVAIDPGVRSELPRRSSNSARSTATTRSISARSASVSNTLARRHKVAIRLILDACCLRCERQRHRHRRHRHCRISVDAFSFVCLFFNLRFSILCFFFFFFFFVFLSIQMQLLALGRAAY
jgi:hypothetical protein